MKRRIEELTEKICGNSKNIVDHPIVLTVFSSWVPNLTLVDLPGITRVALQGQPVNIEEITKKMARFYCRDPKTIILCVIPANQDLSTQDSLKMARTLDPRGTRTLGVLTKVDLMDQGTDCSKILRNEEIPLKMGYIAVKGRSQLDIKRKIKVVEAKKKERSFFAQHPVYSSMPSHLLGTSSLIASLSSVFFSVVKAELPKIKNEITTRKQECREKLEVIGDDFPETEELKLEMIFHLIRRFKQLFETEINGKYNHQNEMESRRNRKKSKPGRDRISFQIQEIFEGFFTEFTKPGFKVCDEYSDADIKRAIEYYHGDSIPGFPSFDSFLFLVDPMLKKLEFPITSMLKECSKIIEAVGADMIREVFGKFTRLQEIILRIFGDFVKKRTQATRKILLNIISCEENYIFTNDTAMYETNVDDKRGLLSAVETNNILCYELRVKVNRYFNIVVRNLRDSVPKLIGRFLMLKVNERLEFEVLNKLSQINYCLDTLEENQSVTDERKRLKKMFSVLSKAEDLLLNSFRMTFDELPSSMRRPASRRRKVSGDEGDFEEIDNIHSDILNFNQNLIGRGRVRKKTRPRDSESQKSVRRLERPKPGSTRTEAPRENTKMRKEPAPSKQGDSFKLFTGVDKNKKKSPIPNKGVKQSTFRTSSGNKESIFDNFANLEKTSKPKKPSQNDEDLFNLFDNKPSKKPARNNPPPGLKTAKPTTQKPKKSSNLFGDLF